MVITGITNNSKYFSADFPDFQVSGVVNNLEMTVSIGEYSFTELYAPDGEGVVVIRDLGSMIATYIDLPEFYSTKDYFILTPAQVVLRLSNNSDVLTYNLSVCYSRIRINVKPDEYLKFLSRYNTIYTGSGRLEYVTLYKMSSSEIKGTVRYKIDTGSVTEKEFSIPLPSQNDCIISTNVSVKKIANYAAIQYDKIVAYTIQLSISGVVYDTIKFRVDAMPARNEVKFVYLNQFGVPEGITFTGYVKSSPELMGNVSKFIHVASRINAYIKHVFNAYSGYIDSNKYKAILDMTVSQHIYLYSDNIDRKEIIVSEYNMERTMPSHEASGIDITFYFASKKDNDYVRFSTDGVFDFTFDNTFN